MIAEQPLDEAAPDAAPFATALVIPASAALRDAPPAALEDLAALLQAARAARVFTVFIAPVEAAFPWPAALTPRPGPHEFVVRAPDTGAFGASTLNLLLRANAIEQLVLAGVQLDLALASLMRDARARGIQAQAAVGADTHAAIARQWPATPEAPRSWQPEVKHARWLRTLEQRVAPSHTALLLIDVQNDFVSPEGATGRREAMPLVQAAVAQVPALLDAARTAGCTVVHVHAEYGQHVRNVGSPYRFPSTRTREGAVWSLSATEVDDAHQFAPGEVEVCLPGSWGGQPLAAAAPREGELQITKHRFSAFVDTPLEVMLRARGIRTLIVAGVTTNCCVESTVRDASMLDFHVVVAEDAVGVKNSVVALHEASLEQMRTYFALVEPVARIAQALQSHAAPQDAGP
ncbi:MAG: isochorismatase family protein [Pseudacidovorax sp.]|nr:isochorismatase family protein [Pseudacidovorax sp.]